MFPHWAIRQAYGLTETCTVVTNTAPNDVFFGSSGTLIPGYEAKVMSPDGKTEITEYDVPGELWAKSPSVVPGYLNNPKATAETFVDGFMKTGDEVLVRKSPKGYEHFFVVDRIKELIKVKVSNFMASTQRVLPYTDMHWLGSPSSPCRTRSSHPHPP